MQVLQAANTGITSLQKLVDTAKSIANQVLQQPSGYTSKATVAIAAPTGAGPLAVAGTVADLTNAGTNSLQGKTLIFKTATGHDHAHHRQHCRRRQGQLDRQPQHGAGGGRR